MYFWSLVSCFLKDDQAAVTVDWVVLTSGLVTIGIAIVTLIQKALDDGAEAITENILTTVAAVLS